MKKINVLKIRKQSTAQTRSPVTHANMDSKLADLKMNQSYTEEQWASFRDTVHSVTLESLCPVIRNNQNWFDEND